MSQTRLTAQDLLAGGCRVITSFLPAEEVNAQACGDASAANDDGTDGADALRGDDQPQTASQRQEKYRASQGKKGLKQLQLWTTADAEKRETLKSLAAAISNDRVHSVCAMVVKHQSSPDALRAMLIGAEAPDVVELGVRVSADDIRSIVDAIIGNPEVCSLIDHFSDDENFSGVFAESFRRPQVLRFLSAIENSATLWTCLSTISADAEFRAICLAIAYDPDLRRATQALAETPHIAAIATHLAACTTSVLENIATAIKHPDAISLWQRATAAHNISRAIDIALEHPNAVVLGHAIQSCPGIWGKLMRRLVKFGLKFRRTAPS